MAHKKLYGCGFNVIGKCDGWDIAIWTDSMPSPAVMLKPLNKKDFVIAVLDSVTMNGSDIAILNNKFCGIIKPSWVTCVNGEFIEISEEEAQSLLNTKLQRYDSIPKIKEGDYIYVRGQFDDDIEKVKIIELEYAKDGIYLHYDSSIINNDCVKMDDYKKWWFINNPKH